MNFKFFFTKTCFLVLLVLALYSSTFCTTNHDGNPSVKHKKHLFSFISYPFEIMWNHKKKVASAALVFIALRFYSQNKNFSVAYNHYLSINSYPPIAKSDQAYKKAANLLVAQYNSWFRLPSHKRCVEKTMTDFPHHFIEWRLSKNMTTNKIIGIVKNT